MKHRKASRKEEAVNAVDYPMYCDYTCKYAEFAPANAVGACRREVAVYCTLIKQYNAKHSRCPMLEDATR